jgi:hypothetical protein
MIGDNTNMSNWKENDTTLGGSEAHQLDGVQRWPAATKKSLNLSSSRYLSYCLHSGYHRYKGGVSLTWSPWTCRPANNCPATYIVDTTATGVSCRQHEVHKHAIQTIPIPMLTYRGKGWHETLSKDSTKIVGGSPVGCSMLWFPPSQKFVGTCSKSHFGSR